MEILANALLDNEVLLKSDVERLVGPRMFDIKANEAAAKAKGLEEAKTDETPTAPEEIF